MDEADELIRLSEQLHTAAEEAFRLAPTTANQRRVEKGGSRTLPILEGFCGARVRTRWLPDNAVDVRPQEAEFEGWFRDYHAAVYRFAYRRIGSGHVDDVVAETFLAAWRRRSDITGDPLPWLLGVARRVCANYLRGDSRRVALFDRLSHERRGPAAEISRTDRHLGDALMSLRASDREVLLLVAWDELSPAQASAVLGISPSALSVRLHRAKGRLAQALARSESQSPVNDLPKEFSRDVI